MPFGLLLVLLPEILQIQLTLNQQLKKAGLRRLLDNNEMFSIASFDQFHRETARRIIAHLKHIDNGLEEKATYGRAAKIIAIYIKNRQLLFETQG